MTSFIAAGLGLAGERDVRPPEVVMTIDMKVTILDREHTLRGKLRERLELAGRLRCAEHGGPVVAVTIHARENGWFESTWTTCCESMERQAAGIVKQRC